MRRHFEFHDVTQLPTMKITNKRVPYIHIFLLFYLPSGFPIPEVSTCRKPLGMESSYIPNSALTASSKLGAAYGPENARLHYKGGPGRLGAWIPLAQNNDQWLQIDLGTEKQVTGISIQGYYNADHWVTSFSLRYSNDGSYFHHYQQASHTKVQFVSLKQL